jgi:hypothetical protein
MTYGRYKIEYEWEKVDSANRVMQKHKIILHEKAMETILEMMLKGYRSGILTESIMLEDENTITEYTGWWTATITKK